MFLYDTILWDYQLCQWPCYARPVLVLVSILSTAIFHRHCFVKKCFRFLCNIMLQGRWSWLYRWSCLVLCYFHVCYYSCAPSIFSRGLPRHFRHSPGRLGSPSIKPACADKRPDSSLIGRQITRSGPDGGDKGCYAGTVKCRPPHGTLSWPGSLFHSFALCVVK